MDIASSILFGAILAWLISQAITESAEAMRLTSAVTAALLIAVLSVDWFVGRQQLLGHPRGLWRTLLKLLLDFLLVSFIGSGVNVILRSKHLMAGLLNLAWSGALTAGLLKLMGVCNGSVIRDFGELYSNL